MKLLPALGLIALAALPLRAQFTVTFANGDSFSAPLNTTAPNSPTTLTIPSGAATQTGAITGTGALTKAGAGNITLTGALTYTGNTTVTGGELILDGASAQTLSGNIVLSGSGSTLSNAGSSALTLSTGKSVSATTTGTAFDLADSTVSIPGSTSINVPITGNGTISIGSGGSLTLGNSGSVSANIVNSPSISGLGTLVLDQGTLTGAPTISVATINGPLATHFFTLAPTGDFTLPSLTAWAGMLAVNGNVTINSAAMTSTAMASLGFGSNLTVGGGTFQGSISGSGNNNVSLTGSVPGGDTLTIAGTNLDLGGTITVTSSGKLILGAGTTLDVGTAAINGFGTLQLNGATVPSGAVISGLTVQGPNVGVTTTFEGPRTLLNFSAWLGTVKVTGNSTVTLGSATVLGTAAVLEVDAGATAAGSIDLGSGTLTKTGAGMLNANMSGTLGILDVTDGVLAGSQLTGTTVVSGNSQVGDGGVNAFTFSGSTSLTLQGNAVAEFMTMGASSGSTSNLTVTGSAAAQNTVFNGVSGGKMQITVSGGGVLQGIFGGAATANVGISTGATFMGGPGANGGTGPINIVLGGLTTSPAGGTLNLNGGDLAVTSLGGSSGNVVNNVSGSNVVLSANSSVSVSTGSPTTIFSGTIADHTTGTGTIAFTKTGAGTFTLGGTNTYSGPTTVSSGTLQFAKEVSLYSGNSSAWTEANLTVSSGATAASNVGGTGEFTATDIATLAGLGNATGGFQSGSFLGLDTTNASGGNFSYSGVLADPNGGANALGLVKLGTHTLTLSGANTYSGATNVNAGLLSIASNTALGSTAGGTTVASGASLELSGGITVGAEALSLAGTGSASNGALRNLSGANSYGGLITLAAAATIQSDAGSLALTNTGTIMGAARTLTLAGAGDGSIASIIGTTTGGLVKNGAGIWTLSGANTFTGATTINAGTLFLTGSARFPTTSGIANNAALVFDGGGNYGSVISGTGALTTQNGSLTLTGTNTYAGGTTISSGTLFIGSLGGSTGSVAGNIVDNGTLYFDRSGTFTEAGDISGSGSLTFVGYGSGVLTLTGNNSYTGGTNLVIPPGATPVLLLNSANALGSSGGIALGGVTLRFSAANQADYSARFSTNAGQQYLFDTNGQSVTLGTALISSGGVLTKSGTGTLTLGADATYSGTTTISAGTLQLGNGGSAGSVASSSIVDNASLAFNRGDTLSYGGVISGSGSLTKLGTGALTLSGSNTFSGSTTVSAGTLVLTGANTSTAAVAIGAAGTLQVGNGTTGSIASNSGSTIANDGALIFNGGANYAGVISGAGSLTKQGGGGSLVLPNDNTYTGGTTISAGTLFIGSLGGGTGSVAGNIVDNGTLFFDRGGSFTEAGDISGTGSLTFLGYGSGVLTLGGNNSFAGGANLSAAPSSTPVLLLGSANALGSSGTISLTGATLRFSATNQTDYSARFNPAAGQQYLFDTNGQSVTFGSTLVSSDAALTKFGAGTLTLGGANTFAGATTVNGGILSIGNATALGTTAAGTTVASGASLELQGGIAVGAEALSLTGTGSASNGALRNLSGANSYGGLLTLAGDATIQSDAGSLALTNTGTITGATHTLTLAGAGDGSVADIIGTTTGGLVKNGTGTWTLSGANTFTGATTINAGTLLLTGSAASPSTGGITNNGALVIDGGGFYTGVISGNGTVTKTGGSSLELIGDQTYTGLTTITSGTLELGFDSATGSLAGDVVNNGTLLFDHTGNFTYAGALSGSGSLTYVGYGAGSLTLSGSNSFSGGVNLIGLPGGTPLLNLGSANAIGSSGTITFSGGGLQFSAANHADYSARFNTTPGQKYLFDTNGQDVTFATALTSSGGTFTKLGTGTLTLAADAAYDGVTTISAGTLQLGNGGSAGSIASSSLVDNASLVFNRTGSLAYAGVISGSGAVTKLGSGTVTLSGNNSFAGATTVSGGTLILTGSNASTAAIAIGAAGTLQVGNGSTGSIANNSGSTIANDGALIFNGSAGYAGVISGAGSLTTHGSVVLPNDHTYTGGTTIASGTLFIGSLGGSTGSIAGNIVDNGTLFFDRGGSFTEAGDISGSGSLTFLGYGSGVLTLGGNNAFSGGANLSAAPSSTPALLLGSANALGNSGTISLTGATLQFSAANHADYSARFDTSAGQKYRFDTNGQNVTFATGLTSSTGLLTKTGAGTLTLNGTNTFTGATTISAGTFLVNGSLANTAVAIASGATLGGSGTIGGLTTIAGDAHLAPGNSPGTITFTNGLTLTAGAILDFQLGTTSDLIRVSGGALTSNSGLVLNLSDAGGFAAGNYTLFDFSTGSTNAVNFLATDFTLGSTPSGYTYDLALAGSTLELTATASAIPEPAACAAIFGACVLALAVARRSGRAGNGRRKEAEPENPTAS